MLSDKPNMACDNISRFEGDHYAKIVCNITSPGVVCDNVKWIFGEDNHELGSKEKWGDDKKQLHIIESYCEVSKLFSEISENEAKP